MWYTNLSVTPDRFTDRARKVLRVACDYAANHNQASVHPEHILWAMTTIEDGAGKLALRRMGVNLNEVELESLIAPQQLDTASDPAPSSETIKLMDSGRLIAKLLSHPYFGTEHFAIGIASLDDSCPASAYLHRQGVKLESLVDVVQQILGYKT